MSGRSFRRRRVKIGASSGAPRPLTSLALSGGIATSSSRGLSNNQKSGKKSTVSSFVVVVLVVLVGVLTILAVVLRGKSLLKSATNSRDEFFPAAKKIVLPGDGPNSLRRIRFNFSRRFPRTVAISQIEPIIPTDVPYAKNIELNSVVSSDSTTIEPSSPELVKGYNLDVCRPMHNWQSKSFPNCNMFHETYLSEMTFISSGTLRSVFELSENVDGNINKLVYKNLDYYGKYNVDLKRVDQERKDGLILERTTRSHFTPSIYGYCSTAVIMDHAPQDMESYNEQRLEGNITISPLDQLKIGIHIASGVADLHAVGFIHNDLHEQQFLYQNGVFKLNDFNYAKPIYVDKNTNETCTLSDKFNMGLFGRSLEELQYKIDHEGFTPVKPDKIDVWMMGNLLFAILTDLQVWDKESRSDEDVKIEQAERLVAGNRPQIPIHIRDSNEPAHLAMKNALDMTWNYNWKERPSARSIADYMTIELMKITGEEAPDLRIKFLNDE